MPEVADGEPGIRPYQDLATSSYSKQAQATITANPVSVAAHRTETMTSIQVLSNDCVLDLSTKVVDDILL